MSCNLFMPNNWAYVQPSINGGTTTQMWQLMNNSTMRLRVTQVGYDGRLGQPIYVNSGTGIAPTASYTQAAFQIADATTGAIQGYFISDSRQGNCSINFTNSTSAAFYRYAPVTCDSKGNCLLRNQLRKRSDKMIGKMGKWNKNRAVCTLQGECDLANKDINPALLL